MTTIIAGRLQQQSEVEDAIEELARAGFAREKISSFYVNPPGQHDATPVGGDHLLSPGAKESGKGVAAGAATGAAVGAAATSFLGPVGTVTGSLVGAHVGGLIGSMSTMKEHGETGEHGEDAENAAPVRKSGMMIAVACHDQEEERHSVNLLRSLGATDIERAQGTIENGDWNDFDPLTSPMLVDFEAPEQSPPSGPHQRA